MNFKDFFSNLKNKTIGLIQKIRFVVFPFYVTTREKLYHFVNEVSSKARHLKEIVKTKATKDAVKAEHLKEVAKVKVSEGIIEAKHLGEVIKSKVAEEITEVANEAQHMGEVVKAEISADVAKAKHLGEIAKFNAAESVIEGIIEAKHLKDVAKVKIEEGTVKAKHLRDVVKAKVSEEITEVENEAKHIEEVVKDEITEDVAKAKHLGQVIKSKVKGEIEEIKKNKHERDIVRAIKSEQIKRDQEIKEQKIKEAALLKEAKKTKEVKPKGALNKLSLIKLGLFNTLEKISSGNPTKVLIVEDENVLADVLEEKFQKAKFTVKIAADGEVAFDIAKIFLPDVILLDLMLPKKDGFAVLEELKAFNDTKGIPVVIMSNLSDDENIKRALKMGATDYFVKSNHPVNEVIEKVKKIIIDSK